MGKVSISIDANGSAFHDGDCRYEPAAEVAIILRRLADKLDADPQTWRRVAHDSNGNLVATLVIEGDPGPDRLATGTTDEGESWSVARYGTQVLITVGEYTQDDQYATVADATVEWRDAVAVLRNCQTEV